MIRKGIKIQNEFDMYDDRIRLELVPKSNEIFCELYLTHYPSSKGIVGRSLNYIIWVNGEVAGIISGNSPPYNYKIFEKFFGITDDTREDMTKQFLNNNAYRVIKKEKNLGTKILKLFRNTIKKDYIKRYGDNLLGLVTFVERPRTGAIYKADNWISLGETQGISVTRRGNLGKWINKEYINTGNKKLIFGIKL